MQVEEGATLPVMEQPGVGTAIRAMPCCPRC